MSVYQKSVIDTGKFIEADIPTAAKTNYQEGSRYINTSNLKSPSRYQQKIQGVRESISSMISQMGSKRNENNEAINVIKNANAEALGMLRDQNNNFNTYTPKKSDRINYPRQNRTIGYDNYGNQSYQHDPQLGLSEFNYQGDFRSNQPHPVPSSNIYSNNVQSKSLEQENMELRKALFEQIQINKDLVHKINDLQVQNLDLKNQLHQNNAKPLRSTRYGTASYGGDTDLNISGKFMSPSPHKLPSQTYIQSSHSPDNYLRQGYPQSSQRYGHQGYGSNAYNNNQFSELFAQLDELKRENESLRHNTINLLRN